MTVIWSWDIEAYIDGEWVSIAEDVMSHKQDIEAAHGIDGSDITSRVASPGYLACLLDNGESNSAGLLGYYSPEHANMRANFGRDTRIRRKFIWNGNDYYDFHGWISDLVPAPGRYKDRTSTLSAFDYMQKLAEQNLSFVPVQEDQRPDQIVQTLLDSASIAPLNTSLQTDDYTVPYALANEQDERTKIMGAIQKVCATALSYVFLRGNQTDGETFVYQREKSRLSSVSLAILDDTMTEFEPGRSTSNIKTKLIGKIHPVRVDDDANTLLYELDNEIYVDGGSTQKFTFRFRDPQNNAVRVSAIDVTETPVANTHFRASATQSGTGNDANSSLSITVVNGGNSSEWTIENTSGSRVYINLVNIFGRGIYFYNPVEITEEVGNADREQSYDFFYLSDANRARGYLQHLLRRKSTESMDVESVYFFADADDTLMGYAMTLDVGDRVTLVESATGINGDFVINHITKTVKTNGRLGVRWKVENVENVDYFILNSSLLNGPHVLSPF